MTPYLILIHPTELLIQTRLIDSHSKKKYGTVPYGTVIEFGIVFMYSLANWFAQKFCTIWKGKVFPKIKRKGPLLMGGTNNDSMISVDQVSVAPTNGNDEESGSYQSTEPSSDYVFRIIINYGSDQNTGMHHVADRCFIHRQFAAYTMHYQLNPYFNL